MTLYQLTEDFVKLLELMGDPETDPEILADTLEGLKGEIEDKAEGYVCVIKELEAQADKFGKEIERLTKQKSVIENNIKRIKDALMTNMATMGKQKILTEHFKVAVVKNGGLQPLKITGDVPDTFKILEPKPDMKRIREALNEGFELGFAHLEERGEHLSIR